ncbi:NAD-aldehyde dehydrogenase [Armillaria gallica]|uniref:Aldehyde dehydrogenase n=1 Tax=Armillaria gallica TaxID=47427 RepID=A0A2H3CR52_ARMGA|nr:NAD-aldehyde dehydrogenase [Armillaria gallica]
MSDHIPRIRDELQRGFGSGKLKSVAFRREQLLALAYLLQENQARFQEAMQRDLGRPPLETSLLDLNGSIREAFLCYKRVEQWAKEESPKFNLATWAISPRLRKEAKGIVLIIGPFNFPIWCLFSPLAAAIAAGNAAVLKPSSHTPATSALIAELVPKYLDPSLYRVVLGDNAEVSALLDLQWDHIFLTGGPKAGRIIATAAAKYLTPITLELGGKSPVIIDPSCDLETSCRRLLWAKTSNAGQICTGPDYVLVPKHFQDEFIEAMSVQYANFYPNGPAASDSFSRIVGPRHFTRIKALLDATKGEVALGGETDSATNYIAPTVVRDVREGDSLLSEELFAPILPVVPVEDLDEAIAYIRARDHPLALYLFAQDETVKRRVINSTLSGSVGINDCLLQVSAEGLPFGGVGPSGYGAHKGKFGFDTFTHLRPVIDSPWYVDLFMSLRFPPYSTKSLQKINAAMLPTLPNWQGAGKNVAMTTSAPVPVNVNARGRFWDGEAVAIGIKASGKGVLLNGKEWLGLVLGMGVVLVGCWVNFGRAL